MIQAIERFLNNPKIQRRVLLPLILLTLALVALGLSGAFADGGSTPQAPFGDWHHVSPGSTCVEVLGYQDYYEDHNVHSDVFAVLVIFGTPRIEPFPNDIGVQFNPGITHCFRTTNLRSLADDIEFQARQGCELRGHCKTEVSTVDIDAFLTTVGAGRPLR